MRLVSWNMGKNTFSHDEHQRAWHYLLALDADIALVQEAMPPPWVADRWDVVMRPVKRWGTAILARRGLGVAEMAGMDDTSHDTGGLLATATLPLPDGSDLILGSVHAPVPSKKLPLDLAGFAAEAIWLPAYRKAFHYDVPNAIYRRRTQGRRFLVTGDWNVSPHLWDLRHPGTHEQEFFLRAEAQSWVDCYDRLHPGEEGQTWFPKGRIDPPYQLDHAFCDATTAEALASCEIDPSPARFLGISDHAPLILDLVV